MHHRRHDGILNHSLKCHRACFADLTSLFHAEQSAVGQAEWIVDRAEPSELLWMGLSLHVDTNLLNRNIKWQKETRCETIPVCLILHALRVKILCARRIQSKGYGFEFTLKTVYLHGNNVFAGS